jgi:aryl-alcohol dehydrogenase-like predicted oxidoreductase
VNYKYLGKTGIQISEICFGTMTFGKEADEDESGKMFHHCLDVGINSFDCADIYNQGRSEELLGKLIQGKRDQLIITSKVTQKSGPDVNDIGSSARHIRLSVEKSLKRLKTDRIDIYFIHKFDPHSDLETMLKTLDNLCCQGKVIYLGVSNYAAWQIMKSLGISQMNNLTGFSCIQPMYNLIKRQAEVEILPLARSENLGVLSYSPLGAGVLTGKYNQKRDIENTRLNDKAYYKARYSNPDYYTTADNLCKIAEEEGVSPAVLAINWVRKNPAITAPIIGARNLEQLKSSLTSLDHVMDEQLYKKISGLTPLPPVATDRLEDQVMVKST